jgi:hypothetical protein
MCIPRLLLIVAASLPLGACFMAAEQIAADDRATCRSAGQEPGTPTFAKCLDDRSRMRVSQQMLMDQTNRQLMQMNEQMMTRNTEMMMMRH